MRLVVVAGERHGLGRPLPTVPEQQVAAQRRPVAVTVDDEVVDEVPDAATGGGEVLGEGDELRTLLAALRRFTKLQLMNTLAPSQRIEDEPIAANKYIY